MTTPPSHHPGERDEILLQFINPSNGNQLLNNTPAGSLATDTALKDGDGIMNVLAQKVSPLELGRMMRSADEVAESKDKHGRVYRLRMKEAVNGKTFQNRLGLLEDGISWGLMGRSQLFDEIDPSIHASASLVRLKGVCLRSIMIATPARYLTNPIPQMSLNPGPLIKACDTTKTTIEVTPKPSNTETQDQTPATSASGPAISRKRKLAPATNETPLRNISRRRKHSRRRKGPRKSYKEWSEGDESKDEDDSDDADDMFLEKTPQRSRGRSISEEAYPVVDYDSQESDLY